MRISFIIPAFNVEKTIGKCVRSILEQSDTDWEIIIVDDGSSDNTNNICEDFAEKHMRIKVIRQSNKGVSCARNRGIEEASGDYICFIDADDWIEKETVSTIKHVCNRVDILFFGHHILTKNKKRVALYEEKDLVFEKSDFEGFYKILLNRYLNLNNAAIGQPWGKAYKREFIEENHLRFPVGVPLSEDLIFNLYAFGVADTGKFVCKPLYNYVINNDSVTQKYRSNTGEIFKKQLALVIEFLESRSMYQQLKDDLNVRIMMDFMYCIQLEFCHLDNKQCYKNRKRIFNKVRHDKLFENACQEVDLENFPLMQKMVCIFIQKEYFGLIDIACKLFQFIQR